MTDQEELVLWRAEEDALAHECLSPNCDSKLRQLMDVMLEANVDELLDEDKMSAERWEAMSRAKTRLWRFAVKYRTEKERT